MIAAIPPDSRRRAGLTLLEVLVAIFITGVGLLALLTLFPLGALEMADDIKDDRAAAFASNAVALSQDGTGLLSQTAAFIEDSLATGSVDPITVTVLRARFEAFESQAADVEDELLELKPLIRGPKLSRQFAILHAEIREIRDAARHMAQLLRVLEGPNPPS